ncbi:MAG: hypothetical protein PHR16_00230 [Methylovulum sp.]|nr:hypothetical protein [Methylovulum sp.]
MRNLTKTLAVVSLLIPASAYPLGIGEIKLHSALNQKLDAEIALVLSPGEKASDIKVNLAPPDKFDESGVLWTYFLSKVKFQTIQSPNGTVVIKVTSNEALKEPFLDFLLEVSWPKGDLYREFTVLVDPPTEYEQVAIPVAIQSENYSGQETMPQQLAVSKHRDRKVRVAVTNRGQYGPTVKNDTLWNIAERVSRQAGVSIEQMMIALYEANPGAFYKQNVNALLAGKTLKIPDKNVVLKFSRQQALDEFNQQTLAWKNRLEQPVTAVANDQQESTDNQLTLVAPKQEPVAENENVAPGSEQVAASAKKAVDASVATTDAPKTETSELKEPKNTSESSANNVAADDEIQAKVAALEKQLAMMQELIALKDQQLSALQDQSQKKLPVEQAPVSVVPSEAEISKPVPPKARPLPPPPAAIAKVEVDDTTYWYYLGGGIVGIGVLTYFGLLWWRNNRRESDFDADNGLAFQGGNKAVAPPGDMFSGAISEDNGYSSDLNNDDNLFTSDFSSNDFDMFDMEQGEIDPIAEADVYLAYGRYQQAEELMRHAISDQSERDECKLKLLEIFYASENKPAFEKYANELANVGKKDDSGFWSKVAEMGSEICPDSDLFAVQVSKPDLSKDIVSPNTNVSFVDDGDEAGQDLLLGDMDFDLASFEELFADESSQDTLVEKISPLDSNDTVTLFDESQANNQGIDFDLSAFSIDTEKSDGNDNSLKKSEEADDQGQNYFESFDFDIGSNDMQPKETPALSTSKSEDFRESLANTSIDDDFDFNTAISGSKTSFSDQESSFGLSDLTEMNAMETKLDLAIAYIDMGDNEAAKEIALEVAEKGTKEQQMVAQSLLDNL